MSLWWLWNVMSECCGVWCGQASGSDVRGTLECQRCWNVSTCAVSRLKSWHR